MFPLPSCGSTHVHLENKKHTWICFCLCKICSYLPVGCLHSIKSSPFLQTHCRFNSLWLSDTRSRGYPVPKGPYTAILGLGWHRIRYKHVAWWHQAIISTNVDLSPIKRFSGHDEILTWKYFLHLCLFVRGILKSSHKGSALWSFGVFFDVVLHKLLIEQSSCLWCQTWWCSCDLNVIHIWMHVTNHIQKDHSAKVQN